MGNNLCGEKTSIPQTNSQLLKVVGSQENVRTSQNSMEEQNPIDNLQFDVFVENQVHQQAQQKDKDFSQEIPKANGSQIQVDQIKSTPKNNEPGQENTVNQKKLSPQSEDLYVEPFEKDSKGKANIIPLQSDEVLLPIMETSNSSSPKLEESPMQSEQLQSEKLDLLNDESKQNYQFERERRPRQRTVTIDNFDLYNTIGNGGFGRVVFAKQKTGKRKEVMALKIINKTKLKDKMNLCTCALLEKNILLNNNHQYITKMFYSWQDREKLYISMQYCQGGEIYSLLRKRKKFTEKVAQIIICEVIVALQYLHQKMKIMYRDIKPENILVTRNGHIKLADFGLSKQFDKPTDRTYTFLGTIEYLSPEMIDNKELKSGYDKAIDIWGIGILLYEFIKGRAPFTHDDRKLNVVASLIKENQPDFIPRLFSEDAQDFISSLMQIDPTQRLGYYNFQDIQAHQFFKDVQWEELESPAYTRGDGPLKTILTELNYLDTRPQLGEKKNEKKLPEINGDDINQIDNFTYPGSLTLKTPNESNLNN